MSMLNSFLNKARETGQLDVTPARLGGPTPVVDIFASKLIAVIRNLAPEVKVTLNSPVNIKSRVAQPGAIDARPSLMTWSMAVNNAAPDLLAGAVAPAPSASFTTEMLDEYAALHAASHQAYGERMQNAPASGFGLAAGVIGNNVRGVSIDGVGFSRCVDSVFMNSYAEAFAVTSFARRHGSKMALELIEAVRNVRSTTGEFDRYSSFPQSFDTEHALGNLAMELRNGAVYGKLGRDDLVAHAMSVAASSVGAWMTKHGANPDVAEGLVDRIDMASKGLATPLPELRLSPQAAITQPEPEVKGMRARLS